MASGHIDEAIEAFQTALKFSKLHYAALAHLARARFLRMEFAEAGQLAAVLTANFSRDAVGPLLKGCIAARLGRVEEAIHELTVAVALDEKSALPHFLLGMVLLGIKRDREAIAHLREATRLDDRSPALQRGLGVAYASQGDSAKAIRALRTSLTLDRNSSETVHALGRVLMRSGDNEEAVQVLGDFISRNPGDRLGRELLAQAYKKQEQRREAVRHLLRALESLEGDQSPEGTEERARLMNNIGAAWASFGSFDEAVKWYKRALETSPHPVPFRNLFGVYAELQNTVEAKRLLDRWLASFPEDEEARLRMAVRDCESGDRRGLEVLSSLTESKEVGARAYAVRGCLLSEHFRSSAEAISVLEEGSRRFPEDTAIANNLAYVYLMEGIPSKARAVLESVKDEDVAESVHLTATWGLLLLWEGDIQGAREQYSRAAELAKETGRRNLSKSVQQKMHLELARHYVRVGDSALARNEVREGLAIGGRHKYRDDLKLLKDRLLTTGRESSQ